MSGFLRNLAAQALGQSAPVRSAARLPYAALPLTLQPSEDDQTSPPPATAAAAAVAPPPDGGTRSPHRAADLPLEQSSLSVTRRHDAADQGPVSAHALPEAASPALAVPAPADRKPAALPPARPIESLAPARLPTPPPLVPTTARFVLPPAFAAVPPPAAARMVGVPQHSADGETAEVHVSIGRIELTAVHEAAPPARRAGSARSSPALHEYLARRQRRPS